MAIKCHQGKLQETILNQLTETIVKDVMQIEKFFQMERFYQKLYIIIQLVMGKKKEKSRFIISAVYKGQGQTILVFFKEIFLCLVEKYHILFFKRILLSK